jgi:hypothetical protein
MIKCFQERAGLDTSTSGGPLEDGKAGGVVVGDSVFRAIGQRGGRKWRIDLLDRIDSSYLCYTQVQSVDNVDTCLYNVKRLISRDACLKVTVTVLHVAMPGLGYTRARSGAKQGFTQNASNNNANSSSTR